MVASRKTFPTLSVAKTAQLGGNATKKQRASSHMVNAMVILIPRLYHVALAANRAMRRTHITRSAGQAVLMGGIATLLRFRVWIRMGSVMVMDLHPSLSAVLAASRATLKILPILSAGQAVQTIGRVILTNG